MPVMYCDMVQSLVHMESKLQMQLREHHIIREVLTHKTCILELQRDRTGLFMQYAKYIALLGI